MRVFAFYAAFEITWKTMIRPLTHASSITRKSRKPATCPSYSTPF
jgi:hypothetical protein